MPDMLPLLPGTPIIWAITSTGSGVARSFMTSISPFGLGGIQELFDRVFHKTTPCLHRSGREITVHHLAHLKVLGPVVLDKLVSLVVPDILVQTPGPIH